MTRRYLLDSGPAFDFLFKRKGIEPRVAEVRRRGCKVGICIPVLGEIVGALKPAAAATPLGKSLGLVLRS